MTKLSEQFDVLSNALRVLPEQIVRLNYFIKEIDEPEEGISNVEIACVNVFNQIYGLMCSLKDESATPSLYEHRAVTTTLCIRHVLQHQSGRLKNCLRDAWSGHLAGSPALIKYNVSKPYVPDQPLYIGIDWFQRGILKTNFSGKLPEINKFWNFERIRQQVEASMIGGWNASYVCAMTLITEAVRTIVTEYGRYISASGYDSRVYLEHFREIEGVDVNDYGISFQPAHRGVA